MYVVVDKKSRKVMHVNPAPLEQGLEGQDVYFKFDDRSMEIVRSARSFMPERFEIRGGEIVDLLGQESAPPSPEIPTSGSTAETRSVADLVKEGAIPLEPHYKVSGNQIVEKSISEKVADGLIHLAPDVKLEGDVVVRKTDRELLQEERITLDDVKKERIQQFSAMALQLRASILPDYKLQNAALGIYDEATAAGIRATVAAFRDEFHRLEALINEARDLNAIEAVREKFLKTPVASGKERAAKPKSPDRKKR